MLLEQIETPALVVDMDVFEENQRKMKEITEKLGVALRPHYKSNKCMTIVREQLKNGAKGICCAKLSEAEDLINAGVEDVLIANQVTAREKISRLAYLAKCCRLTVAVDSLQNVEDLEQAAAFEDSTVYCLVEYEIGMKRCGVASKEELLSLAREIEKRPHLVFEGIQAYAGHLAHEKDPAVRARESAAIEDNLCRTRDYLLANGLKVKEISGTSTGTSGNRRQSTPYTEIQAGSYIFMDATYGRMGLPFDNSLFVLTTVMSKAGGLTIADAGMKTVSMDQDAPYFLGHEDAEIDFSEEHSSVSSTVIDAPVGAKLKLIPSHCCTCVNQNDWLYLVRGGRVIDRAPITSRGKSL